jgi:hypothetical protein
MADLVIVNAGQHCWGVERERLFAALKQLGWCKRLDRWYAPLKPRAKPISAARQLYNERLWNADIIGIALGMTRTPAGG